MLKKLLPSFKGYYVLALLGPLLIICEVIADVTIPKYMGAIINQGVLLKDSAFVWQQGLAMVGVALFALVCGLLASYVGAKAGMGFGSNLRHRLFAHIGKLSFAELDQLRIPSLITRLTNDVERLGRLAQMGLRMSIRAPLMFVMAFIMALRINKSLSLVFAVAIPLMILGITLVARRIIPKFRLMQQQVDNLNAKIQESLRSIRVVKAFVREDYEQGSFEEANQNLYASSLSAMYTIIILMPLMAIVMYFCIIAVLWFGGLSMNSGGMQAGDLYSFIMYIGQVLNSVLMVSMVLLNFARGKSSAERVLEVLETESSVREKESVCTELQEGSIEFRDVTFTYAGNSSPSLQNISCYIAPGSTVGILGATGSGKSTLVQLIPRLYDVSSGSVLVGGVDVRDYSLSFLREQIALVLQQNSLFSGSIRSNLGWGKAAATAAELDEVLQLTQASTIVSQRAGGLEAEVEQEGSNFSGGQKQRLCLARTLLKRSKILLLDDATSAIDMATEREIVRALNESLPQTTKLIIAQRIQAVQGAEQIILLDKGRINAIGSHAELLASNEIYQDLFEAQMKGRVQ